MLPKYTPFDETAYAPGIGVRPLDLSNWIEIDEHLPKYLAEKHRLIAEIPDLVWAGDFSSEAAQQEVLGLLVPHLLEQFPETYSRKGNVISVRGAAEVDLENISVPPLQSAAGH